MSTISPPILPSPDQEIKDAYSELVTRIDQQVTMLIHTNHGWQLKCRPGCYDCCINFSVLPLEAALICLHLAGKHTFPDHQTDQCPLLHHSRCRIYAIRPVICRTQGLPLGYFNELYEGIEVSACPLNFDKAYEFIYEEILLMDDTNSRLFELNRLYCAANNIDPLRRISLLELAAACNDRS